MGMIAADALMLALSSVAVTMTTVNVISDKMDDRLHGSETHIHVSFCFSSNNQKKEWVKFYYLVVLSFALFGLVIILADFAARLFAMLIALLIFIILVVVMVTTIVIVVVIARARKDWSGRSLTCKQCREYKTHRGQHSRYDLSFHLDR
jgi:glycerol uptake facilitator-like aquaporin